MKVVLTCKPKNVNTKVSWLYFGSSNLKMKYWENKIYGKRINIQNEIHDQVVIKKKPFLEWIESQRIANKDSINWWMTQIAGKNNAYSSFFVYLCQLFAVQDYLKKNTDLNEILIVCEDAFLLKLLANNLPPDIKIKLPNFLSLYFFKDITLLLIKGLSNQFRLLYLLFIHYLLARITKPKKMEKPINHATLIHNCLNDNNSFQKNSLTCIYFTILPNWLKEKGKKVFGLPWFFKLKPSINIYKKLRNVESLIPEDWLNFLDYIGIYKNFIKSIKTLKYKILFPNAKIDYLIFRERLCQLGEHGLMFWRYIPAIKKWSSELKSLTVYDQYQNMLFEHPIRYVVKNLPIQSKSIGYYHSLVSKEYMVFQHLESEWQSQMKPDFVVCSGKLSENLLLNQGVPRARLISGPALRQSFTLDRKIKKQSNQLLILLSLVDESCIEILTKIYLNNFAITNDLKLKIKVKLHPLMKKKNILRKLKWNNLPEGWEWAKNDLYEELNNSYCCIAMDTAAVFDAIIKENIVISLKSDLNLMENYLDFFTDKYPFTNSISENELVKTLQDIFLHKKEEYKDEFKKIKNELIDGITPVSNKSLGAFIEF